MANYKDFYTTAELASLFGVSRIAIFKRIKKGEIKAKKIGRNYAIPAAALPVLQKRALSQEQKGELDLIIKKIVKEYGETLRLLGND